MQPVAIESGGANRRFTAAVGCVCVIGGIGKVASREDAEWLWSVAFAALFVLGPLAAYLAATGLADPSPGPG